MAAGQETTTLDRLSHGRLILGVGIGSPAYGDFGIFHEPDGERDRAELLDEGLNVMAGLWSGNRFSYSGQHFTLDPVRFSPAPVQQPRIPVWVGGVLPAPRPIARAARWDGIVPIRFAGRSLVRPSAADIAETGARIAAARTAPAARTGARARTSTWSCGRKSRPSPPRCTSSRSLSGRRCHLVDRDGETGAGLVGRRARTRGQRSLTGGRRGLIDTVAD